MFRIALQLCKTKYNILFNFYCLLSLILVFQLLSLSHRSLSSPHFFFFFFSSDSLMAKPVASQAKLILHNIYKTLTSQTYTPHTRQGQIVISGDIDNSSNIGSGSGDKDEVISQHLWWVFIWV